MEINFRFNNGYLDILKGKDAFGHGHDNFLNIDRAKQFAIHNNASGENLIVKFKQMKHTLQRKTVEGSLLLKLATVLVQYNNALFKHK